MVTIDPKALEAIVARSGMHVAEIARKCGISRTTLYNYLRTGKVKVKILDTIIKVCQKW